MTAARRPGDHCAVTFDIEFSGPFRGEGTGGAGAPTQGGHAAGRDRWYVYYGMDFTAPGGTVIHALCDMVITRVNRPSERNPDPHVYGADVFARSWPGERVGLGFMHLDPASITVAPNSGVVHRGDPIGRVLDTRAFPPHSHVAMAQRFPRDQKMGISSLYRMFLRIRNSGDPVTVRFAEDMVTQPQEVQGATSPPPPAQSSPTAPATSTDQRGSDLLDLPMQEDHPEEAVAAVCMPAVTSSAELTLATMPANVGRVAWLQRHIGNRATAAAVRSPGFVPIAAYRPGPAVGTSAHARADVYGEPRERER